MNISSTQQRMRKLFLEGFSAMDIAEPLLSFDADKSSAELYAIMSGKSLEIAGIREHGLVEGYVHREDLKQGSLVDNIRRFNDGEILTDSSYLQEVIIVLEKSSDCFISSLGNIGAYISRREIQKPPVRMWLFGLITILEMYIVQKIKTTFPNETYKQHLSQGRLEKAQALMEERRRRNQSVDLLDCLQLSDKGQILIKDPAVRQDIGIQSINEGQKALKELESLRNNLAHSQDIIHSNWNAIVIFSKRLHKIMTRMPTTNP